MAEKWVWEGRQYSFGDNQEWASCNLIPNLNFETHHGGGAVIGVLGTIKMQYPSRAFDMAHCSRCLTPLGANDGIYMKEVHRVLGPGEYWVLSGPPINWKTNYKAWQRPKEDLEEEQRNIEGMEILKTMSMKTSGT